MIIHFNNIASNVRNCHLAYDTVSLSLLLLRRLLSAQSGSFCRYVSLTESMLRHSGLSTGQVRFYIIIIIIIIKISTRDFCTFVPGISYVAYVNTRVGTLIVANIYLQLIQNRHMFRSFTVLQCSHQHCVQPVASDVEVVGYL